ncbi:MAG: LptF/LptG family permease [Gemmataceae bacterium]
MTTLDRQLLFSYFRSYFIVLSSLLSLYVVIDLFTNLDAFADRGGLLGTLRHIATYYGYRITQIFDKLSEFITLLAAVFTVSWMQRSNELMPQLSAGVSTRRVIRPVVLGALMTIAFAPLNQELLIPRIADALQVPRDDPESRRAVDIRGAFDTTGVHIEGVHGYRTERRVEWMYLTFSENNPGGMLHVMAPEAIYTPATSDETNGYWTLYRATPATIDGPLPANLEMVSPGVYVLRTRDVDFDTLTRGGSWYLLASTAGLHELLNRPDPRRQAAVAVLFHNRLVRPIVGAVLILLGLGVILRDQNRHVLVSTGIVVVTCAIYYASVFACKYLGEQDLLSPILAAWCPILVFGPLSIVLFDAMQT